MGACLCARSLESMLRTELLIKSVEADERQPMANESNLVHVYPHAKKKDGERSERGGKKKKWVAS